MSDVVKKKLANGLTLLLKEDHRLPLACVLTWVNVGYFNEPDPLAGISHFIEHLFFKGTSRRGVGRIAQETKEIGGYLNASTIYDHTFYYTVVPAKSLARAIDIQSDALMNPLFNLEEMTKEKEVIIQELKRKYDNPDPYAWEKLLTLSFDQHRIRRWRMGTEEQIRNYPREEVISYYHRYYRPENINVVIVGDFKTDEVLNEVERHYGLMNSETVDREESAPEGKRTFSPRMMRMVGDVSQPLVKLGFQSPSILDKDYPAMSVLNVLLGRGRSSRLYRALKEEKRIVDGVGSSLFGTKDVGFFTIELEVKPENLAQSEEEVWVELDRVLRDPPSAEEIDRVRNILETNFFSERQDVMGQAQSLAYFESIGGYEKEIEYLEKMRSVTPEQLISVMDQYVTFNRMNLMEYVPTAVGEGAPTELRIESLKKRVATRIEKAGARGTLPSVSHVEPVHIWTGRLDPLTKGAEVIPIENGVTLLHLENKALPMVSVAAYFPGGRLDETEQNCGITQFVLGNSIKGTESKTADEIAFQMESLGSSIRMEANADQFGYSTALLSRNLDLGLELLSDVLLNPTFPDREMEIERNTTLASLRRLKDDNFRYPIELFYRALYGMHPYGLPRSGSENSVGSFSRTQLIDWYHQAFSWKKMVVAMVGDVERSKAIDLIKQHFSVERDVKEQSRAQIFPVLPDRGSRERIEERDKKQTAFAVGFRGIPVRDSRMYALEVFRNIWSGMGGRLFMELREKHALAYTVAAFNISLLRGGAFFIYMATSPGKEEEAKNRLLTQLEKARALTPTPDEMTASKTYTRGAHAMGLQGNSAMAFTVLDYFMSGRGIEALNDFDRRIDDVTSGDVQRVASEVIQMDRAAYGIVRGKAK